MNVNQLRAMFSQLRVQKLAKAGHYRVYNVNDAGVIGWKKLALSKGTTVFVSAKGQPILKVSCGNPMARGATVAS